MQVRTFLKLALAAGLFALGAQLAPHARPPTRRPSSCRACGAARR
jgi:hypothetical protein